MIEPMSVDRIAHLRTRANLRCCCGACDGKVGLDAEAANELLDEVERLRKRVKTDKQLLGVAKSLGELRTEQRDEARAQLASLIEPGPITATPEEWENLRACAPGLVDLIENAKPVVVRERVVAAREPSPRRDYIAPQEPFNLLVRRTENHLRELMAEDLSAPLVNRLRRESCTHDWSAAKPLRGHDDAIDCLECGLRVIDGYRPQYTRTAP